MPTLRPEDAITPGIEQLLHIERLPLLRPGVRVHFEGSIDKLGKNADWDWWLYQDADTQEWVICEVEEPGCLWNFVVHHAVGHSDPVYRFYVDGSPTPAFEIRHSEFGRKTPFTAPLAEQFFPDPGVDERLLAIDFRVVRSFCPIPFARSLRITSSVKLEGNHTTGGGWGHAIWHSYASGEQVTSFTGQEDLAPLLRLWQSVGEDPKPQAGNVAVRYSEALAPGSTAQLFNQTGEGSLTGIRLHLEPMTREILSNLWIKITWEDETAPAIECPMGAFFGNEFGLNRVQTLLQGVTPDGGMYNYWPMPFWTSAKVELENRGRAPVEISGSLTWKPAELLTYPREHTGHFRASAYQPMIPKVVGRDSPVATIRGSGHMVAGVVSAVESMCEGDVRVHIDGCGTAAVESDGSESWICYGWGFEYPPQQNPASSYDGTGNASWSMLRLLMGECYPFRTELRMTVEGGDGDEAREDPRSGIVFWYGEHAPAMALTDLLEVGNPASEAAHAYKAPDSEPWELTSALEGEFDHVEITGTGRTLRGPSQFKLRIAPGNTGVLLRRRSDQQRHRQRAHVYIDGQRVTERAWLYADANPHFRWLEDEFMIPASYTAGKEAITITIQPADAADPVWSESLYWAFSLGVAQSPAGTQPLPEKALPAFLRG